MPRALKNIKVGDRVWISGKYGSNKRDKLKTVVRLTPKQIILDGIEEYSRYKRGVPSRFSPYEPTYYGIGLSDGAITFIATEQEIAKWDAEQEAKRQQADEAKREAERIEAKRVELGALFSGEHVYVRNDFNNKAGAWRIEMWLPDEATVRELAARINEMSLPTPTVARLLVMK